VGVNRYDCAGNVRMSLQVAADVADGKFRVGCGVCSHLAAEKDKDVFGRYEITRLAQCKQYRFKAHADSKAHIDCVLRILNPKHLCDEAAKRLPTSDELHVLLGWLRKGQSIREGVPAVGTFRKCRKMLFTLSEALQRIYREWLAQSCTINLLRDERHSRLLIRFRAASLNVERFLGVLGQPRLTKARRQFCSHATGL